MSAHELIALLLESTVAASIAVLLVLALRRQVRKDFGAAVGYGLWVLVPAAIVAVLLPAAAQAPATGSMVLMLSNASAQTLAVEATDALDLPRWLGATWLLGAIAMAWRFARQQRAFRQGLGALRRRDDGLRQADSVAGLPAAIGLWRPLIVVPADFDARYTPAQQRLMQAHERTHIRRGDLQLNAVVSALRCVFWFNPLLHVAARHFRHDQELACDQHVIARHPNARREYGEAMFKTQLAAQPLPLGCHWLASYRGYSHPLKERIAMLKQPVPSRARWIAGSAVVVTLALAAGFAAWAAQPHRVAGSGVTAATGMVTADVSLRIDDGKPQSFRLVNRAGEPFSFQAEENGQRWDVQATVTPRNDGTLELVSTLSKDGKVVSQPRLVAKAGAPATIRIGEQPAAGVFKGIEMSFVLASTGAMPAPLAPPAPLTAAPAPAPAPAPPALPTPPSALPAPSAPSVAGAGAIPPTPRAAPLPEAPPATSAAPTPAVAPTPPAPVAGIQHLPAPAYPAGVAKKGIGGKVVLVIDIDAQGKPTDVQVERSEPAGVFDQAAIDAARKWQFNPEMEHGKAVAGRVRVPVEFAPKRPAGEQD